MVTGEHSIDSWLFRDGDGRPAGEITRLGEQVWQVDLDGARRSVVHTMWVDVMDCLPLAVDPSGMTATADRWDLAWNGAGWAHLYPSLPIPEAWAVRIGPDARMCEVLSPDATTAVAPEVGALHAGDVRVPVYLLGQSRYFSHENVVIIGDGADLYVDITDAVDGLAARIGVDVDTIEVGL